MFLKSIAVKKVKEVFTFQSYRICLTVMYVTREAAPSTQGSVL